jgi:hypothetical protein
LARTLPLHPFSDAFGIFKRVRLKYTPHHHQKKEEEEGGRERGGEKGGGGGGSGKGMQQIYKLGIF